MTPRGLLVAVAVLALFLAIFVPLAMRVTEGRDETEDAGRMRRVYVALALYESEHDGLPAPNLGLIRRDVNPFDLASINDPHVGEGSDFPLDPAVPTLKLRSISRVSWTYRWHWPNPGDPGTVRLDPRNSVLASWWTGSIDATSPDGHGCTGPAMRIQVDGSLVTTPRKDKNLTFRDLFGKQP